MTYNGLAIPLHLDNADVTVKATTDDRLLSFGELAATAALQKSIDIRWMGNIPQVYLYADASASMISLHGPGRLQGFNRISNRFELKWVAGQRGKPSLNADIQNAAEGTRMIADPDFEVLGTNMTSALSTFNVEGGITLTTAGADADQAILLPHLDANQSAWSIVTWGTDQQTQWEADIAAAALITTCILWAGLKLTNVPVVATDNNQAYFRYENGVNGGKWQAIYSIAGVDTEVDTGVTVALNTRYHLRIDIDSSRIARFYIDGVLVATSTALANTTDLIPYVGVEASGAAAARAVRVLGCGISRVIALP